MARNKVIWRVLAVLLLAWGLVFAVRGLASSRKITAEKVDQAIAAAAFEDWSEREPGGGGAEAERRERELRRIADLANRLDFHERERNRNNRSAEEFFRRLDRGEKNLFIELTVVETMGRFMEALDAMPAEDRRRFVEQGLREIREGRTEEEIARARELGDDLLDRISEEGMRAYFEKAGADTKLDLAPLMESMNELMQGMRGNEFGPPRG